ncbi:MAG: hypothetical protein AAF532_07530 [Planctomycetota bacterium]
MPHETGTERSAGSRASGVVALGEAVDALFHALGHLGDRTNLLIHETRGRTLIFVAIGCVVDPAWIRPFDDTERREPPDPEDAAGMIDYVYTYFGLISGCTDSFLAAEPPVARRITTLHDVCSARQEEIQNIIKRLGVWEDYWYLDATESQQRVDLGTDYPGQDRIDGRPVRAGKRRVGWVKGFDPNEIESIDAQTFDPRWDQFSRRHGIRLPEVVRHGDSFPVPPGVERDRNADRVSDTLTSIVAVAVPELEAAIDALREAIDRAPALIWERMKAPNGSDWRLWIERDVFARLTFGEPDGMHLRWTIPRTEKGLCEWVFDRPENAEVIREHWNGVMRTLDETRRDVGAMSVLPSGSENPSSECEFPALRTFAVEQTRPNTPGRKLLMAFADSVEDFLDGSGIAIATDGAWGEVKNGKDRLSSGLSRLNEKLLSPLDDGFVYQFSAEGTGVRRRREAVTR